MWGNMPSIDPSSVTDDLNAQGRSGMSRRSVVRTGVAAAWAVPLIQVAAAAPSFAASGPADLSTSTIGTPSRDKKVVSIPGVRLINSNNQATTLARVTVASTGTLAFTQPTPPSPWIIETKSNSSVTFKRTAQL